MIDPGIGNIHIKGKTVAKNKILAYNNYRNELTISGQPKLNLKVTEHWEWRLLFSFYLYDFNNQHGNAKHDCEFCAGKLFCFTNSDRSGKTIYKYLE